MKLVFVQYIKIPVQVAVLFGLILGSIFGSGFFLHKVFVICRLLYFGFKL